MGYIGISSGIVKDQTSYLPNWHQSVSQALKLWWK